MEFVSIDSPLITWALPIAILCLAGGTRRTVTALFGTGISEQERRAISDFRRLSWASVAVFAAVFAINGGATELTLHRVALLVFYAGIGIALTIVREAIGKRAQL